MSETSNANVDKQLIRWRIMAAHAHEILCSSKIGFLGQLIGQADIFQSFNSNKNCQLLLACYSSKTPSSSYVRMDKNC